jgi:outer membrane protein insertion porin family
MKKAFFLLAFLLATHTAWADAIIRAIEVKGNQRVQKEAVIATIESKVGTPYSPEKVKRDLQALYRMGVFENVKIEKEETAGGIKLIYTVEERSNITKITFIGNKKVKEEKLRTLIDIRPNGVADSAKLASSVEKIREYYASEGYHLAEVTTEFKPITATTDEELVFTIREGDGVRIKRINFIGNKAYSDNDLRSQLKSKEKGWWSFLSSGGKYQEEMIKRDTAFLAYYYQNNGFLKAQVAPPNLYLTRDRKWIVLTFHIREGEKYKISQVGVEGDILTTKQEMLSKFKMHSGMLYSRKDIEEDLVLMAQMYGDQGYAFANINPVIVPNDEDHTASVTYVINKGNRVYIDKINIIGNTTTRDKVIRRELLFKENTLYNESRIRDSKQRLEALGYFSEVNFATPRGSADNRINVNITVKEKPTGTFSVGAGFSSVENFIFTASIAKDNFLGYGISGQFSTELSSKRQLFVLSFEDPYFMDSEWILGLSGFRTVNVFTDFDRKSFGGTASLGHRVFDNSVFRLGYQVEDVHVGSFQTTVPYAFSQNLAGLTSSATLSMQRDTRNNRLFPTQGMYNNALVEFAGLGGSNDFIRATENFRYYQPIWKSLVGKFNFNIGQISSFSSNLPVPLFERYFLGGVNSLRGYYLRSIGPAVQIPTTPQGADNTFVYGGNKTMQFNFELEFPIYEPAGFKFVGFYDAGNAFAENQNFSVTNLRQDYGFGLRWNSPFGPLRFEWGFPIDRQPGEDQVIFNFTIGSFF